MQSNWYDRELQSLCCKGCGTKLPLRRNSTFNPERMVMMIEAFAQEHKECTEFKNYLRARNEIHWRKGMRHNFPNQGATMKFRPVLITILFALALIAVPSRAQAAPTCPTGTNHCASLSWTAPTTGGTPAGYNIYRSTANGGCANLTASTCTKVGSTTAPTLTFMDAPLAAKTTYFWVLTSTNLTGESIGSTPATGTTADDTPGAPGTIVIVLH